MTAQDLVNWLLEAHTLKRPKDWPRKIQHFDDRFWERVAVEHRLDLLKHLYLFATGSKVIAAPDSDWMLPLPMGYRLLGNKDVGVSILNPSETLVKPWVRNPYLSATDLTWWRGVNFDVDKPA